MSDILLGFASLIIVAISTQRWVQKFRQVAIPKDRTAFIVTWVVAAGLGITSLFGEPGYLGGIPATLGTVGSLFFLTTVAIGKQKVGPGAITVGATLPDFTSTDEHGQPFDSQSLAGHPVLIKFFRAHW
ncbi:MAG: hypothetical protein ACI8W3_000622 [Myxococcota bacterium]|jgi:hypothetical protein